MPSRQAAQQSAPANFAPLIVAVGLIGAVVGTFFQLPGAVIAALGVSVASFFYHPPANADPKLPASDKVQMQMRRWDDLRWRTLVPNGTWVLNDARDFKKFGERGKLAAAVLGGSPVAKAAGFVLECLGFLAWFVTPTRFIQVIAIGAALFALTLPANLSAFSEFLPPELLAYDLVWVNAVVAYGAILGAEASIRNSAAISDPSPGVGIGDLLHRLTTAPAEGEDDQRGGAWRALIGFVLLGAAAGLAFVFVLGATETGWWFQPIWLAGAGLNLVVGAACLHGYMRESALEPWRDKVAARAEWVPRWEALKYPETRMLDHERIGPFVVDTFEAPPSLGSAKAMNLYDQLLPYLAGGGDVSVAMLSVPSMDSQGQPMPGSAHATRFRIVVAPGDTEVATTDPAVDVEQVKLAAEIGAFIGAKEVRLPTPILMEVNPAHTPDSPTAVWETVWSTPLASTGIVAAILGVDAETGSFSEGRVAYFGDFDTAKLADRTMPARMEQAAYTERWGVRWSDALKMGEKQPFLQYGAIRREKLTPSVELTFEPFLVSQGLSPAQFFTKDMTKRLTTTLKAAPFVSVIGITGAIAGKLGPGVRHPQGFAVIHSATQIPSNPAEIAPPGGRARDVAAWVLGGLINRAFEDAKLPYPEVIEATALTTSRSVGHIWRVHLRLYDGVTASQVKQNSAKIQQGLGGVRWMRVEASEHGAYLVVGAAPQMDGVRFSRQEYKAYCDELDWRHAFDVAGIRALSDGKTPDMLANEPHESNEKITRMVFSMPSGMSFGKVIEATDKLSAETGNAYVDIRQMESPSTFEVLAAELDPIPFPAFPDWEFMADTDGKKRTRLPFAQTTDGSIVSFDWSLDPHLNVLGSSGGGKSILLQILMAGAILRDCDVFLIDPIKGGQDFDFAVPYVRAMVEQGDYLGAGELLQFIGTEAEERKKLNVQYKVGNYKDLPDDVRPRHMFVIIDEFQSLLKSQAKLPKEPESDDIFDVESWTQQKRINDGVGKVAKHIGKLAREARSVGITLVLAGQAMKATDLQAVGLGGLKSNFSRIAVGKMSYGDLASAFKEANTLPKLGAVVPPGRGLYESTAAPGIIIQNWWQPPVGDDANGQPEMGRQLARRVPAIPDDRRVDVEMLTQRVLNAAPKAFGAVLDADDLVEDAEDVTIELDASDLGLDDLDLSFDDLDFGDDFSLADEPAESNEAEEPAAADSEPEEEFTLLAPPTDLPLEQEATGDEDAPFQPEGAPMFDMGQFAEMTYGLSGEVVIGRDIVFGVNAPTGDGTESGWPDGDALELLLAANPGISTVVWADESLDELDEIGIPRSFIAADIAARFDVTLLTELPDEPAPAAAPVVEAQSEPEPAPVVEARPEPEPVPVVETPPESAQEPVVEPALEPDDFLTALTAATLATAVPEPAAEPEPVAEPRQPAAAPTLFDLDDFDMPAAVPTEGDDMFQARRQQVDMKGMDF